MLSMQNLRDMLAEACHNCGGQSMWAEKHGLSAQYVSDVIRGRRDPGKAIADAFGLEPRTMYFWKKNMAVHHIDGNPYNNDPTNLRVVQIKENKGNG